MARVKHKVAIETGAARGLGFAIANSLAMEGAAVVLTDVLDELGAAAAGKIAAAGGRCSYMHLDVTDAAAWAQLVDAVVAQYGGVNILVNNAGIVISESIESESLDNWRKTQSVNLDAVFMGTRQAVIAMHES